MVATTISEAQGDYEGPYEVIEGLMEPKIDLAKKQELMVQMLSSDLTAMEKEQYLRMLFNFPKLFITLTRRLEGSREKTCTLSLEKE